MRYLEVANISDSRIPCAKLIISGRKTWEISWHNTSYRGNVAIIFDEKILGTVKLADVFSGTPKGLARYTEHMSTEKRMARYARKRKVKKLYAWVLSNPKKFIQPKKIKCKYINIYRWCVPKNWKR